MSCWLQAKKKGWATIVQYDCKNSPGCIFLYLGLTTGMKAAIKRANTIRYRQPYPIKGMPLSAITTPLSGDEYREAPSLYG